MKKLLCAAILLSAVGVSLGADAWVDIEFHKMNIYSIQECVFLKKIFPSYVDMLDKLIIASKQGKTFQYGVEIKVDPQDEKALSATLFKPNGMSVSLKWDSGEQEFVFDSWHNPAVSLEEFTAEFPPGQYRIDVQFVNSGIVSYYQTVSDYNQGLFTDIPDTNLTEDLSGQLVLNWGPVDGASEYDLGVESLKSSNELYHKDFSYPSNESTSLGVYKTQDDYRIELTACVYDSGIEFHTHAILFSFKNLLPVIKNEVTKCSVKAGSKENMDSIDIMGTLDAIEADFLMAMDSNNPNVIVTLDSKYMPEPMEFEFPISYISFKKGKYVYARQVNASQSLFNFDTKNGKMKFSAKKADLTGLGCPLDVTITIGDYEAEMTLDEDVVNGTKDSPFQLMMGVLDRLEVAKYKIKHGNTAGTDTITAQGIFTIDGVIDPFEPFVIGIGSQSFTVLGGAFTNKNGVYSCKNAPASEGGLVTAKLDTNKCTFSLAIKNATVSESGDVDFEMDCFGNSLEGFAIINLD